MANPPERREYDIDIPAEVEPGTYADFASIWHTADSFVLDFAVLKRPPKPSVGEDGSRVLKVPTRVVTRVRVPPSQVFEIMKGLEKQLSMWERSHGVKRRSPEDT
ncbi:DUF3467 domain-containing protein [Jiangella alkaliphila]|uniref:DUF3467 domain-containing protein n=1 Tax=Jiangella alkaliphila TaxID=419479 RepID=A0A1H2LPJ5_9ACTN|nr:DUF3467 domain-containing protein [Jiangella alkaliphila]SDU82859.1 Protein of unknown function [Jiangella alkaliphila]